MKKVAYATLVTLMLTSCQGREVDEVKSSEPVKKNQDVMVVSSRPIVEKAVQIKPANNNIKSKNKPIHIKTENKQIKNNKNNTSASEEKDNKDYIKIINAEVTAYYISTSETGKSKDDPYYGITASGTKAKVGRTIAMSKEYPFGTIVELEDGTRRIVEDRGGAIKGNKVDLLVSSRSEAIKWGRKKNYKLKIIKWGNGKTHFNKRK